MAAALLLLAPALWNGYPLIFFDSGDYLMATLAGDLVPYRDPVYGFLMAPLHLGVTLWGVAFAQCLLTAWLLREVVRQLGGRFYLPVVALLAIFSSLPWFSGQIMPDILGALAVLLIFLLGFGDIPAGKRWLLTLILAAALASHLSFLPLAAGLLLVVVVLRAKWRQPVIALTIAPLLVLSANLSLGGPPVLSQTSHAFLLARLMQDGIAKKTLDRLCPDPALKLCAVKDRLPATANDFLWGDSESFALVGGWLGSKGEADRIIGASLRLFPLEHLVSACRLSLQQLISFDSGEGLESQAEPWGVIEPYFPLDFPLYESARQQTGRLDMRPVNKIHRPVAAAAMLFLPVLALLAWRRGDKRELGWMALVIAALLGNAIVCGVLSNPNHRYESRVVWLAVFAVTLACANRAYERLFPATLAGSAVSRQ